VTTCTSTSVDRAFELLDAIAHESRPVLGARDDRRELRHHLTTVTDTERERVRSTKEFFEDRAQRGLNKIDFAQPSPAPSTSPYEKPPQATSPRNSSSPRRPANQVGHVQIVRFEAGAIEHRRHLGLAVDPLLAQDRDLRSRAARDIRGCHVDVRLERQIDHERRRIERVADSNSSRAHCGSSRSARMRNDVSVHSRFSVSQDSSITTAPARSTMRGVSVGRPMRCVHSPSPCAANVCSTAASSASRTCKHDARLFGE
jgi:hypothetical protein